MAQTFKEIFEVINHPAVWEARSDGWVRDSSQKLSRYLQKCMADSKVEPLAAAGLAATAMQQSLQAAKAAGQSHEIDEAAQYDAILGALEKVNSEGVSLTQSQARQVLVHWVVPSGTDKKDAEATQKVTETFFHSNAFAQHAHSLMHEAFAAYPGRTLAHELQNFIDVGMDSTDPYAQTSEPAVDRARVAIAKAILSAPAASLRARQVALLTIFDGNQIEVCSPSHVICSAQRLADSVGRWPPAERGQLLAILVRTLQLTGWLDTSTYADAKGRAEHLAQAKPVVQSLLPLPSADSAEWNLLGDAFALTYRGAWAADPCDDFTSADPLDVLKAYWPDDRDPERLDRMAALADTLFGAKSDPDSKSSAPTATNVKPADWLAAAAAFKAMSAPEAMLLLDGLTQPAGLAGHHAEGLTARLTALTDVLACATTIVPVDSMRRSRDWLMDLMLPPGPARERLRKAFGAGAAPSGPAIPVKGRLLQLATNALSMLFAAPAALVLAADGEDSRVARRGALGSEAIQERGAFLREQMEAFRAMRVAGPADGSDPREASVRSALFNLEAVCREGLEALTGPEALELAQGSEGAGGVAGGIGRSSSSSSSSSSIAAGQDE